ncbi:thermosome subunit [Haladaptatus sp. R4]|uniref:thermosome subunit alpha n=1 Tax=Haladaptatus sp. R4 TaxID=1679489 RepID=UPI0007B4DD37|nr:thermosome subunit alpha [Haladaptatus sp. R4]KZN24391.1 thermosome subunit [Haladaptatus sp. R4]
MQTGPILILGEEAQRTSGRDAREMNVTAGRAVAEAVRTTLGPRGMDKMLVDSMGDVVVTNDGVTILTEMDIEHPAATMMVEVAETQEDETGDGTTTAVILAGDLLRRAEDLLEQGVHPTTVARGYRLASEEAYRLLEAASHPVEERDLLTEIAQTAMTGKGAEAAKEALSELVVRAVRAVYDEDGDGGDIDLSNVTVETVVGGGISDSELVEGVVVDKERVNDDMPWRVEDATIALVDTPIEVQETETDTAVSITDPDQLQGFLDREEAQLREMVERITDSGANVVFCQKGIDDMAQHLLAQEGVLAVRRAKKSDVQHLARATGARVVSSLGDIDSDDLGHAGIVEERNVAGDTRIFVEGCDNPRSVTLLLRGGTEHVVEEVERAVHDSLGVVRVTLLDGQVLPGGGAPETTLALGLREYADGVGGREQLAVEAFADAMETVPRTLAENAGISPIDGVTDLRSRHDAGEENVGLDAETGEVVDMLDVGVVEPRRVKSRAIGSATDVAELLLRIDDVISAGDLGGSDEAEAPEPGGMGGMGGMGGAI